VDALSRDVLVGGLVVNGVLSGLVEGIDRREVEKKKRTGTMAFGFWLIEPSSKKWNRIGRKKE